MRIFNRVVMIVLLGGLFVAGVYAVVYAFDLFGYALQSLLGPLQSFGEGASSFMRGVEGGEVSTPDIVLLVLLALLGLILLIAELKPPAPRRVRMEKGTYVTRGAVESEASAAAEEVTGVLGSKAKAKAKRRSGAQVELEARVRRGEDLSTMQSGLRSAVQEDLSSRGVPVSKLNVKLVETDPRETGARVR